MISFLNPFLLFGILAASIPVIIHLINKKKAISHKFAAIEFILQTNKRIAVKFKLRQLILLILRASLLVFLALALARPFIKNLGGVSEKNAPTSNVIIVDDSYSMQYADNHGTFFTTAKKVAREIVDNLTVNDEAAVITCSGIASQVPPELDYDKKNLIRFIEQLPPHFINTKITSALDAAVEILANAKTSVNRIFLITDLTRNGWDIEWFKTGYEKLKNRIAGVHIIDMSGGKVLGNRAIINIEQQLETSEKEEHCHLKVTVFNFSSVKDKDLLAQVFIDGGKIAQGFFSIGANTSGTKEFFFSVEKGKDHTGWVEIPDDNLNVDNRRYFTINSKQQMDALLIDGDPGTNIYESETFYLEKALNPGREHASPVRPRVCFLHEIANIDFSHFNTIFLCNVNVMPPEKIGELEHFVKEGGSVVFSMGNKVDTDYYNRSFESLLPHKLRTTRTFSSESSLSEDQPLSLKMAEFSQPLMGIFSSENFMNLLSSVKFYRAYYVEPESQGDSKTILSFSNGTPALIEKQIGRGKSVLFTSSIDRDWTDFPVKPVFLPMMQHLCKYLAGNISSEVQKEILVGYEVQYPYFSYTGNLEVTDPEGLNVTLNPQLINNDTYFLYNRTDMPGIYTVTAGGKPLQQFPSFFPVNVDTTESNLDKIDRKEVTALMGGTNVTFTTSPLSEGREVIMGEAKKTLWGAVLFLAVCIFLIESFISKK